MSDEKDEKWLDEVLRQAVDSGRPEFDAEKWKEKHRAAFQILQSHAAQRSAARFNAWRKVMETRITKLAAAAAIIVVISFSILHQGPGEQAETPKLAEVPRSPAEMMTAMSLHIAFRQGGIEAVETQCQKALKLLGPRPRSLSVRELLKELNSNADNSERTKL
jgi:hypothetical protein